MGKRESIAGEIAVGYLISNTLLESGARFRPDPEADLHADAEAVVHLGREVDRVGGAAAAAAAIAGYGAALELVDLATIDGGADSIVIGNVFHRAGLRRPPVGPAH